MSDGLTPAEQAVADLTVPWACGQIQIRYLLTRADIRAIVAAARPLTAAAALREAACALTWDDAVGVSEYVDGIAEAARLLRERAEDIEQTTQTGEDLT
jgi:hypothetical protein